MLKKQDGKTSGVKDMAKLLGVSEEALSDFAAKMEKESKQRNVLEELAQKNKEKTTQALRELGFSEKETDSQKIYQALLDKIKTNNQALFEYFGQPDSSKPEGCQILLNAVKDLAGELEGFYLKEESAKKLFLANPRKQIMAVLGYDDINKMLAQENIFELFAVLRFVEDKDWLNQVFFKAYESLTQSDFEKREIKLMALPERWAEQGESFLRKKRHHMSHLKELGVVFVIPTRTFNREEIFYILFMALHYLFETDWHSKLFEKYSHEPDFAQKLINILRVETSQEKLNQDKNIWRIMPGYLAKDDAQDPRLFEPHLSLETLFFDRASRVLSEFSQKAPQAGLDFWQDLDTVACRFGSDLISFSFYDNGIAYLKNDDFSKRQIYHQQEALWNKIFEEYMGEKTLDKVISENLEKGYVIL